ncbi:MAG: Gfo/Idh/MocA family oxidoreductase [Gammaproteobacteria bacterium]|nr:Gfo/Idh/MocA family oxidoreductase [Gammaproteobacteria bacterium]
MSKLKTAVIGVDYLGKFHADKYAAHEDCDLIAVVDANADTAKEIADKHGVQALTDYTELLGKVDGTVNLSRLIVISIKNKPVTY